MVQKSLQIDIYIGHQNHFFVYSGATTQPIQYIWLFLEFVCLGDATNIIHYLFYYIIGDMVYQTYHDFLIDLLIVFTETSTYSLRN